MYRRSSGILTAFPVQLVQLGELLGLTYSQLIDSAEKPWPFRHCGFPPQIDPTAAGILIPTRSTYAYAQASAHAGRLPTLNVFTQ